MCINKSERQEYIIVWHLWQILINGACTYKEKAVNKAYNGHVPPAGRRTLNIWFGQNGALVVATQQLQVKLTLATVTFI